MIADDILQHLNKHSQVPQTIEEISVGVNCTPPVVRDALHRLCSDFRAHLVRPGGEFAYLPGPHPRTQGGVSSGGNA